MIGLVKVNDDNYIVACGLFFVCFGCFEYMEITSKQILSQALLVVITLQQLLPIPLHFPYSLSSDPNPLLLFRPSHPSSLGSEVQERLRRSYF